MLSAAARHTEHTRQDKDAARAFRAIYIATFAGITHTRMRTFRCIASLSLLFRSGQCLSLEISLLNINTDFNTAA